MGRMKLDDVLSYEPHYEPAEESGKDPEPGLPSIHTVHANNSPRLGNKDKVSSYMREGTAMLSQSLDSKLTNALQSNFVDAAVTDDISSALTEMVQRASSTTRFDTPDQFKQFLTEGVLLNVNKMASQSIGVPQGEYVVYQVKGGKTMLIPTADVTVQETDFAEPPRAYEVHTKDLLGCWDKTERTLYEAEENGRPPEGTPGEPGEPEDQQQAPDVGHGVKHKKQLGAQNRVHPTNTKVHQAIQKSGKSLKDIADECGIAVSTASRYGTKDFTGEEPGGRRPSIDKAIEFANAIGLDVEAAFGDLPPTKKREATKGSGGGRFDLYQRGAK